MVMLHELQPAKGSKRRKKRVGRGIAAGQGKTAGRGTKGQKAREKVPPWFEGGQTPLYKRAPKLRGETKKAMPVGRFRKECAIVNVQQLEAKFEPGETVTPDELVKRRLIDRVGDGVRILGDGELTKPLTVYAHYFSLSAKAKIEEAGGKTVVI